MNRQDAATRLDDIVPLGGQCPTSEWDLDNEALKTGASALLKLDELERRAKAYVEVLEDYGTEWGSPDAGKEEILGELVGYLAETSELKWPEGKKS